mmetsp:Transcript_8049/g.11946  ORF Transcript_8049/g.11946 Transcript_8049/m.11946 type:complete len:247 (+) Transcript_8049:462-1202(+)
MVIDFFLGTLFDAVVDLHNSSLVTATITVVGGRENSHDTLIVLPLVPFHHKLMSSSNKTQPIDVRELLCNVLTKRVSCSSWAYSPSKAIVRIGPHQITHWPLVGNFLHTIQFPRVVKGVNRGTKTAVKAEYLIRNDSCHWKIVKCVRKVLPYVGVTIFSKTFIIKSIYLSNLPALMISSQNCNTMSVSHLQGHQQSHSLQTVITTIDVISHKQIVGLRDRATDPKKLCQIVELTMNITAYSHRGSN